mmetsp:Transcript_745/g.1052  ORF Transcript_745/g.1052 Transcript_745/m.1052 type:complete len:86 (+) Transcript_745:216-473(+)
MGNRGSVSCMFPLSSAVDLVSVHWLEMFFQINIVSEYAFLREISCGFPSIAEKKDCVGHYLTIPGAKRIHTQRGMHRVEIQHKID